ncbi:FAD-dependent pyridine nucleotide-disulfide oxidoreductase [Haladaptatus paucihalophilus DX253]|uniref:FAD-dependent pyridine nucleotide-disulfide oxidoreductase n=1 Tax=Haladaptatus paucihalophilus DX253 TaxID=797209 RepID=E7QMY8_HALPU|nr:MULTISPECIES: FAD/NAD(P)-binding oxidoreductase [Haladaptatus]EFW93783.1 FAD-dependent pyridine nucleotide-disulfide oxidoreductase [Haladaptatus paucihalophilus DX253]GKZ15111.1 pyridine nucleotide-disulfide oxidoreductase [Haladaptatus sp. T7]SHL50951.1 sulfide:quinone oxidoreductase [Haladaptatus paucihalophilus DX253]
MKRIAIVGGGTGGTVLANRLADELAPEIDAGDVEVTLVTDDPDHVYKPLYLYVAFGEREAQEARRPISELLDSRVELRINRVVSIDTDEKRLSCQDGGTTLDYDYLVLSTGAKLTPEDVPGLKEGGHHFYGPDGAEALRDDLAEFTGGHLVLSVIGVPHMCPAAPLEFVFMADDWLRERGRRDDVEITYTYPIGRAHGLESIAEWATPELEKRDINVETFFNADEVDPEEKVIRTMEGTEMDYDLLVAIPPHSGDDLIKESGLGDDGWVPVDKETLEADAAADVYAIGDTADVPTSKAGSVAHYEAGVVADRLASRVRGHTPTAIFDGKTVCFIESGMDEATFVEFEYGRQPTVRDPSKFVHWAKLSYNESYWLTARGLL